MAVEGRADDKTFLLLSLLIQRLLFLSVLGFHGLVIETAANLTVALEEEPILFGPLPDLFEG